jgi:hypothetical protein
MIRQHIQNNKKILFIFEDNGQGFVGMAKEFRGEPNTIGIRTQKTSGKSHAAYWIDSQFDQNKIQIDEDIERIRIERKKYVAICIPNTIGESTIDKSPLTYAYLKKRLGEFK